MLGLIHSAHFLLNPNGFVGRFQTIIGETINVRKSMTAHPNTSIEADNDNKVCLTIPKVNRAASVRCKDEHFRYNTRVMRIKILFFFRLRVF